MEHVAEHRNRALAAYARRFGHQPTADRLGMSGSLVDGTVVFTVDNDLFIYSPADDSVRRADEGRPAGATDGQ